MLVSRVGAIAILSTTLTVFLPVRAHSQTVDSRVKQQTQQVYFLLDRCEPAVAQRAGGNILVALNTLQSYFISNAENGLTGEGSLDATGGFRPFRFDCRVNIRDGRVTGVTTTFLGDPPGDGSGRPNPEGILAIVDSPNGQPVPLRYGPGTEYFVIENLPQGASVTLSGRSNGDWAETLGGAWVYRPYLRLVR
ncbi:SH3 domain-containing protein [Microcoleus sp. FACHB-1515]|uniref:SH3 domain-containing protein n=1 Tax=Cyanophyceae TaxID=3028117 RepID=UPI0016888D54|nr:SH3 domain-containing protein [Microcoleus sp. FACHB-1515]MBD2090250.1 SH3 domain-containing protein [Microcoleus sp. FACHB-1515]